MSTDPYIWIAAILTLGVFSFLWRDNVVFCFIEHMLVGLSAGYMFVTYWNSVFIPELVRPLITHGFDTQAHLWVPVGICFLWTCKFVEKTKDMYRLALAFWLAIDLGLAIPTHLEAGVIAQVRGAMNVSFAGSPGEVFGNMILVAGTTAALVYFFFSREHKGVTGGVSKVGTWVLMIGFGASFSYVILSRIYLLIGRLQFLLHDWLGLVS